MTDFSRTPNLSALHRLAYAQDGLFTSKQARCCGLSAQLLAHHARSGRFERVRRGLYRLADYPSGEHEQIRAAWLTVGADRAVVSHESALVLHGLCDAQPQTVHLLVAREHRGIRPPATVKLHTALQAIPDGDIATRHGIRASIPARAIVEAASSGTEPHVVRRAIAEAFRQGRTTPAELAEYAERGGSEGAALVKGWFARDTHSEDLPV
jgi:predicted transcriptional regulator of viral defense system